MKYKLTKSKNAILGMNNFVDLIKYVQSSQLDLKVTVYSLAGRKICSFNSNEIHYLKNISNGLYLFDVQDENVESGMRLKLMN